MEGARRKGDDKEVAKWKQSMTNREAQLRERRLWKLHEAQMRGRAMDEGYEGTRGTRRR